MAAIKRNSFLLTVVLAWMIIMSSCDNTRYYEDVIDLEKGQWHYNDTLSYAFEIDEILPLNLLLHVRHDFYFEWRNMWVIMDLYQNDSLMQTEDINILLSEPSGEWYGSCSGNTCDLKYPLKSFSNFEFPDTGSYKITLVQDMRSNPLEMVRAIGVRLEKVGEQNSN